MLPPVEVATSWRRFCRGLRLSACGRLPNDHEPFWNARGHPVPLCHGTRQPRDGIWQRFRGPRRPWCDWWLARSTPWVRRALSCAFDERSLFENGSGSSLRHPGTRGIKSAEAPHMVHVWTLLGSVHHADQSGHIRRARVSFWQIESTAYCMPSRSINSLISESGWPLLNTQSLMAKPAYRHQRGGGTSRAMAKRRQAARRRQDQSFRGGRQFTAEVIL